MLIILTQNKLHKLLMQEFQKGLGLGYQLGWKYKGMDITNRGFIISSKVDNEIEKLLRDKGL